MAARKKPAPKKAAAKPKTRPADSAKGGRPTKRTPEIEAVIREALEDGCSMETACAKARIARNTLDLWRKADPGFRAFVSEAKATGIARRARQLLEQCDAGNVQALQFWLTRRAPEFREAKDQPLDLPDIDGIESVADLGRLAAHVLVSALRDGAPGSAVQAISGAISGAAKAQEVTELRAELESLRAEVRRVTGGSDGDE